MATWDITGIGGNTSAIAGASGTTTIQTLSATAPGDFDGNNVTLVEIFNAGSTSDQGSDDTITLTTFDMVVNGTTMSIPQSGSALATGSTASTASGTTAQWEGAAIDIGQSYTRSGKQDNDFFTISGVTVRVTYTPAVPNDPLSADDVSTSSDVSAPSVQETHVLSGSGPTSASFTGAPAVTQEHTLLSNGTASASDVSVPTATEGAGTNVLTADDVTSASDVSAPSVQETHILAADGVFSQTTTSASSLGQGHGLSADGSTSSSEVGSPNAGQSHVILADGVSTGSDVSSPNVGEVQDFTADDTSASSSVSAPSAGQSHVASADGVISASSVSAPALAGTNVLTADSVSSATTLLDLGSENPELFSAASKSIGVAQAYTLPARLGVTLYCQPDSWHIFSSSDVQVAQTFSGVDGTQSEFTYVSSKADLPFAVGGVHTLLPDHTYFFTGTVDLMGGRMVGGMNTCILGASSENAFITSTGLGAGVPLFYSERTTPIRHVTFKDVDMAFEFQDIHPEPLALDWTGVNFTNVPNVGLLDGCDNWIFTKGAFLNSGGLVIDGTSGTISIADSLLQGSGAAYNLVEVAATATITRRFRVIYSSVIAFGSTAGLDVDASATVPTEGFILDTVNFGGGGNYLPGIGTNSNSSLFSNCNGIVNTAVNGQAYMRNNATATTISAVDTFVKVAGTTLASADNAKYTHTANRLTNTAAVERKFLIQCHLSFTSGSNNVCEFGFYDSKLGAVREPSRTTGTANSSGRLENLSFSCVVQHSSGDYLEIWCANTTGTTDITVESLNFIVTEVQ